MQIWQQVLLLYRIFLRTNRHMVFYKGKNKLLLFLAFSLILSIAWTTVFSLADNLGQGESLLKAESSNRHFVVQRFSIDWFAVEVRPLNRNRDTIFSLLRNGTTRILSLPGFFLSSALLLAFFSFSSIKTYYPNRKDKIFLNLRI